MAGTERKFGRLMSAKALALGMTNTRFRNASGLPNRRQLTTARDLARLITALHRDFPLGDFNVVISDFPCADNCISP